LEGLIISGTGLLGSRLAALSDYDFTYRSGDPGPDRGRAHRLDLRDLAALRSLLIERRPRVVILSAAMTDVDACEEEREEALRVNYEAPAVAAEAVRSYGGYLVFISTDYVFDGLRGNYREEDPTNPVNFYGRTKEMAERRVEASGARHAIVRTSALFGGGSRRKDFVLWAYGRLREGGELAVVDQVVSPTPASYLARAVLEIAGRELEGIIHVAGREPMSRAEMALRIKERFGLGGSVRVVDSVPGWRARRPRNSSLSVERADALLRNRPPSFEEGLGELEEASLG
jgi:dTDP-4-dehydrorhamnose reductase